MRAKRRCMLGSTIVVALLAQGCGSTPTTRYYLLESPASAAAASAAALSSGGEAAVRVAVGAFEVEAPYDRDGVAYRPEGRRAEIGFYQFHRWAVPLERALPEALAAALDRQSGISAQSGIVSDADVTITGRVLRLEEVDTTERILAEVELEVSWSGARGDGTAVLRAEEPLGSEARVVDVVEGLATALDRLAGELAAKLR